MPITIRNDRLKELKTWFNTPSLDGLIGPTDVEGYAITSELLRLRKTIKKLQVPVITQTNFTLAETLANATKEINKLPKWMQKLKI